MHGFGYYIITRMNRTLNWGLLSTAHINHALIRPIRSSARSQLLAVASRNQPSAEAFARRNKIPRSYGSYEQLLADPEIDIVYNPLPNNLHAQWTINALRSGKHVLCEKPLALTLEDVDAVRLAARESGRLAVEAFMYRHHPQTLQVKQLVEDGAFGRLQLIKGSFTFMLDRPGNYRLVKEMGGGSLWDVGCYPVSYARFLTGAQPIEVFGRQVLGADGVDLSFFGMMRFPGDIFAQFDCGFASPFRASMEIIGSDATLNITVPFKPGRREKIYLTRGGRVETIKINGQDLYLGEVEDLCDAIQSGTTPRLSLEDSRATTAAILALLESANAGRPISNID